MGSSPAGGAIPARRDGQLMTKHSERLIPVTLLTGFLGAGKTTLLNRILNGVHGVPMAVVVNDFGAINIDSRLVQSVDGQVMSLSNGCICCDRRGDLGQSLLRLVAKSPPPEAILIETSGVSDPLAAAALFRLPALAERVSLDAVVTVVDAENGQDPRLDAQLIRDQIVAADIVVLNKIDLVDQARLAEARAWIEGINPRARIVTTAHAEVPLALLIGIEPGAQTALDDVESCVGRSVPGRQAAGPHHDHHTEYESWHYHTDAPLTLHELLTVLKGLPAGIFRAKGIVHLAEAPGLRIAVQVAGRRVSTDVLGRWEETPESHLVFIGQCGSLDRVDLQAQLNACCALPPEPVTRDNEACAT